MGGVNCPVVRGLRVLFLLLKHWRQKLIDPRIHARLNLCRYLRINQRLDAFCDGYVRKVTEQVWIDTLLNGSLGNRC